MVLGKTGALQITWFILIVTFVVLLPQKKTHLIAIFFDLEAAYDTTGNRVYYLIFMTLIFQAICLASLMGFCLIDCSRWEWDDAVIVSNKLHEILPKLSDKLLSFSKTRKEDTILNRLHIGHSYLIHSFLLKKKSPLFVLCAIHHYSQTNLGRVCWFNLAEASNILRSLYSLFWNATPDKMFD